MTRIFGALIWILIAGLLLVAQSKMARIATVTPDTGKPGGEYVAAGENLGSDVVKDLFITNGKDDVKVAMVTQKSDAISFKVPGTAKPGPYRLMTLTADGKQFIEQPVKLVIE